MKRLLFGLAACLLLALASPIAHAAYRITFDGGGSVDAYIQKFMALRDSGGHVVVDGQCLSACTMVLLMDRDHVCITKRAELAFHSAFQEAPDGGKIFAADATAVLWHFYPKAVRDLLKAKGWDGTVEQPVMIWLDHDDLSSLYPDCPEAVATRNVHANP